jgi:hypothetical protein
MDCTLALLPIKLVRTLNRPIREKILICVLMGMGLVATSIAGYKMTTFTSVNLGDPLSATVKPSLWAKLEELVGIIAACVPCLKSPIENALRRFGILAAERGISFSKPSFVLSNQDPNLNLAPVGSKPFAKTAEAHESNTGLVNSKQSEWKSGSRSLTTTKSVAEESIATEVTESHRWGNV